jgi:hypothetical protein
MDSIKESRNDVNLAGKLNGRASLEGKIETYSSEVQKAAFSLKKHSSPNERKNFAKKVLSNGQEMADYLIERATTPKS